MSRSDRITLAAGGCALVLAMAGAWFLFVPTDPAALGVSSIATGLPSNAATPNASPTSSAAALIVVDVEGAVETPGIRELRGGARVADAIAAAGGYASDADLAAAAATLNLAQPLSDGEQIRVPRIGETAAPGMATASGPPTAPGGGASGLVDLNTATPEALEALPGIGPVTVQKIVAARQEQPFTSLDDAVQRGVINRGQLEDIQALATAG